VGVGQLAPSFALSTLAGPQKEMTFDDLLGVPTVLSFWTTWCPYCLQQTPVMVAGAARTAGQNVQFIGIDVKEQAGVVADYAAQHAIPYPILLDTDGSTAAAYAVTGYPTTYFLDAAGRIVALQIGAMSEAQLAEHLDQLLVSH
jgi:thiol-disulfide isomerase/thioredoxin